MRNREFVFTPKIEYKLVAESAERANKLREANLSNLQFPFWCAGKDSNLRCPMGGGFTVLWNSRYPTGA